jgi:hypothetical protein
MSNPPRDPLEIDLESEPPHRRRLRRVDAAVRFLTQAFFLSVLLAVLLYFGVLWRLIEPVL